LGLAATTAFVLVLTLGSATAAQANTSGSITGNANSSDPELIKCPNAAEPG